MTPAGAPREFVLFEVGDHLGAVRVAQVEEVLPIASLSQEPGSPAILAGFLNLDGEPVPVLRLSRLIEALDAPSEMELHTPVLLARHADRRLGLIVRRVLRIVRAQTVELAALGAHGVAPEAIEVEGRLIPVFSVEGLLLEEERARLAKLQDAQRNRLRDLQGARA
jgi:purine-binding chemotaxis protein CheW